MKCASFDAFQHVDTEMQLFKWYVYEIVFFQHYFISLYGKVVEKRKGKKYLPLKRTFNTADE